MVVVVVVVVVMMWMEGCTSPLSAQQRDRGASNLVS